MTKNKDRDLFEELLDKAIGRAGPFYQPMVGYLMEDGSMLKFQPVNHWMTADRAICACLHSMSRRMDWLCISRQGRPIRAIGMVVNADNKIVWKVKVDLTHKEPIHK